MKMPALMAPKNAVTASNMANGPMSQPSKLTARNDTQSKEFLSTLNFQSGVRLRCNTRCLVEHALDKFPSKPGRYLPELSTRLPIPAGVGISARRRGPLVLSHIDQLLPAELAINKADDECQHDRTSLFDRGLYRASWFQDVFADSGKWLRGPAKCFVAANGRNGSRNRELRTISGALVPRLHLTES
jgi:hypothetical protein